MAEFLIDFSTALKQGRLDSKLTKRLSTHMASLNRAASEAAVAAGARAATDITGFGFLGHTTQLADASRVTLELQPHKDWFLPRVLELAAAGVAPGGLARNRSHYSPSVAVNGEFEPALLDALYDPQTSGGLFVCVPERKAAAFARGLAKRRVPCFDVGRARKRGKHAVVMR